MKRSVLLGEKKVWDLILLGILVDNITKILYCNMSNFISQ